MASPPQLNFGPGYWPQTAWENQMLIEALQASQGQIGARVRGIAIEAGYETIVVHACVDVQDHDTLEDLTDMAGDMEASIAQYVEPAPTVELQVYVGDTDVSWPGYRQRRLFLMHWRARHDDPASEGAACGANNRGAS